MNNEQGWSVALSLRGFIEWWGLVWFCCGECAGVGKEYEWKVIQTRMAAVLNHSRKCSFPADNISNPLMKMLWKQKGNKAGLITGILITLEGGPGYGYIL